MTHNRRQSGLIAVLIGLLIATFAIAARSQDDPLRHGYALLIGISKYEDPSWPRLDDIDLQIHQLQKALGPHFDEVKLLQDQTFDQLDSGIRHFLRTRGNDDDARLLIYYAGHGYQEINESRNEYRGYITGVDTPSVDGSQRSFGAARPKSLSMEAIRGMVTDTNARQLLFIFDSCFAGTVFAARSPGGPPGRLTESDIAKLLQHPVREFITAGDMNERIPAHSPIPQLLVNALNGNANLDPDGLGVITGQQIAQYLWSQTRGVGISPREGKLLGGYFDQGEFLFRVGLSRPPRAPKPAERAILPYQPAERRQMLPPLLVAAPFAKPGRIFTFLNGELSQVYARPDGSMLYSTAVGPRGDRYFVNANQNFVFRLDGNNETVVYTHNTYVRSVRFDPQGNLYFSESTGAGAEGTIFRLVDGQAESFFTVRRSEVNGFWAGTFAFDRNGALWLSSGNMVPSSLFKVESGHPRKIFDYSHGSMIGITFTRDGTLLFVDTNGGSKIVELRFPDLVTSVLYRNDSVSIWDVNSANFRP